MAKQENPEKKAKPPKKEHIIVVDDDEAISELLKKYLENDGYNNVTMANDGNSAWETMQTSGCDLLILDWHMAGLGGLTLINRIRKAEAFQELPVLVVSGYLSKEEFSILDTLYLTARLSKPVQPYFFKRKVDDLLAQAKWFRTERGNVFKKGQSLDETLLLIKESPVSLPLSLNFARKLREENRLKEAESAIALALHIKPDSGLAKSELGKVRLLQGNLREAENLLTSAQREYPGDLENICSKAEVHMMKLETLEAKDLFDQVLQMDPDDMQAKDGMTLTENMDDYFGHVDVTELPETFAGLLNAIGVYKVKQTEFEEGFEHYQASLQYVHDDVNKSKVAYNIGLCHERWRHVDKAVDWYRRSLEYWVDNPKSLSCIDRLASAGHQGAAGAPLPEPGQDAIHEPPVDNPIQVLMGNDFADLEIPDNSDAELDEDFLNSLEPPKPDGKVIQKPEIPSESEDVEETVKSGLGSLKISVVKKTGS